MSLKLEGATVAAVSNTLAVAVAIAAVTLPPLGGLSAGAQAAAGIGGLMAVLWVTETIPLAVTALLPVALFPLTGVASLADLSTSYANPVIFLFLGGFMIAKAIEKWGLHRRLAFSILARTKGEPKQVVLSVMAATAFLSLWISNTASTMVAAPIAASIAAMRTEKDGFGTALMLGVAYAATIGGMGSLIGTPPNALFAAYMQDAYGIVIGFAEWMLVGLPVVVILLPVTWIVLTRFAFTIGPDPIHVAIPKSEPMSSGEKRLALVASLTALGWIFRPLISKAFPGLALSDGGIAMTGALALFVIGSGTPSRERLLDWKTASSLRWDVLILFGGGLSLASAIERTGLAGWIGDQAQGLEGLPTFWILLSMALIIVYLGELASNTAMAAIFLPVAGAAAVGTGAEPLTFTLPVAMAASIGFMLPVATPPNAIVFSNPLVDRRDMLVAGAPLDLVGIGIALLAGTVFGPLVF
ncbi:SLC13 family permease [Roseibium aggregatum]|uniref:DASS family sodium-coupled anion symporter n=1 Tax=Roseibium aggregatum TaxID=187304 RepID=A0A939ECF6_9HYPH|nr:DASS family sodium-coupled anion symporter [Roseibium aggregatum]MBN9670039.1 DASS family sodium-coupled anion symporter [Roseibium aggregatum]